MPDHCLCQMYLPFLRPRELSFSDLREILFYSKHVRPVSLEDVHIHDDDQGGGEEDDD